MTDQYVGVCIMRTERPTEPKIAACAVAGIVAIETQGMGQRDLTIGQAKAFRRGLSRCIREAEAQLKGVLLKGGGT